MSPASSANRSLVCWFSGGAGGVGIGSPSASGSIVFERRQIEVDDVRVGPILEGGRVSREDQEISSAGGGDVPEPNPLASEFLDVPSLDVRVIGRLDPEDWESRTGRTCDHA